MSGKTRSMVAWALLIGVIGCSNHRAPLPATTSGALDEHGAARVDRLAELRTRVSAHPDQPYWSLALAEAYLDADSSSAAERALRASLAVDATYAPALALLSRLYFDTGRSDEAVELLEPALATGSLSTDHEMRLRAGLALHLDALGRLDQADAEIDAVARVAREPAAWRSLGSAITYVRLRGEAFENAAASARQTLDSDRESAVALNNHGISLLQSGDPVGARKAFLEAIEREPDMPGPLYNLAILERYYLLDDDAAADWFGRYWSISHDDPDGLADTFDIDQPVIRVAGREE